MERWAGGGCAIARSGHSMAQQPLVGKASVAVTASTVPDVPTDDWTTVGLTPGPAVIVTPATAPDTASVNAEAPIAVWMVAALMLSIEEVTDEAPLGGKASVAVTASTVPAWDLQDLATPSRLEIPARDLQGLIAPPAEDGITAWDLQGLATPSREEIPARDLQGLAAPPVQQGIPDLQGLTELYKQRVQTRDLQGLAVRITRLIPPDLQGLTGRSVARECRRVLGAAQTYRTAVFLEKENHRQESNPKRAIVLRVWSLEFSENQGAIHRDKFS